MSSNIIPNKHHQDTRGWMQPPKDEILVGDQHATMTRKIFEQLIEERPTKSPPTCFEGKMWKVRYHDVQRQEDIWYFRWYVRDAKTPNKFLVFSRKIIIGDWKALAGIK